MITAIDLDPQRVGRITGSRIAPILGLGRYQTNRGVLREMVRQYFGDEQEFQGNVQTDWGHEHEAEALADMAADVEEVLWGGGQFAAHPRYDFLGYTPDAQIGESGLVEVKCPWRAKHTHISERPDYFEQIQLGLEVLDLEWCYYGVWRPGYGPGAPNELTRSTVLRDPDWLDSRLPELQAFIEEFQTVIEDEDLAAVHRAPLVDERVDPEWAEAAEAFLESFADEAISAAAFELARKRLVTLSKGKSTKGLGVGVTHYSRKGAIEWPKFAKKHAPDADPEEFRKTGSSVATVRRLAGPIEEEK